MKKFNLLTLLAGPLSALIIYYIFPENPEHAMAGRMAGLAVWMAVWWITEATHLAVTALLPIVFMPLLGIADPRTVAAEYMDPVIFLFIGGFLIAFAIERWGLHKRLSLKILSTLGGKPQHLLAGIMGLAWFISMWISNTATVMMLFPAVLALILQVETHIEDIGTQLKFARTMLLGLAYSATIGGMATLVGTPPNMVFISFYRKHFADGLDISFANWFMVGFPLSLIFVFCAYFILKQLNFRNIKTYHIDLKMFKEEYINLGRTSTEEKIVFVIFSLTAILWFTRTGIEIGNLKIKGWNTLFYNAGYILDSTVAMAMALLLFFIPSTKKSEGNLLRWKDAERLPLSIIILFGGGFALAKGFEISGLSSWLAGWLSFLKGAPVIIVVLGICLLVTFISEFASNVASIQLTLPVLIALQQGMDLHPLLLMIPATFAASLGFMLPVATAPNTIVFSSNRIKVIDMMRNGFMLNIIGVIIITIIILTLGRYVWNI